MKERTQFFAVLITAIIIIAVVCFFGFSRNKASDSNGLQPEPLPDVSAVIGCEPNIKDIINDGTFVFKSYNYVDSDENITDDSPKGVDYYFISEDTRPGQRYNVEVINETREEYEERINNLNDTAEKIISGDVEFVYAQRNQLCVNKDYEINENQQKQIDRKILELKYTDDPIEEIKIVFSVMWYKDGMTYNVYSEGYGNDVKEMLLKTAEELTEK